MFEYHVVNKLHLGSHSQLGQAEWRGTGRMAARTVAAAYSSCFWCTFVSFIVCVFVCYICEA